jgi:hypothetical protein
MRDRTRPNPAASLSRGRKAYIDGHLPSGKSDPWSHQAVHESWLLADKHTAAPRSVEGVFGVRNRWAIAAWCVVNPVNGWKTWTRVRAAYMEEMFSPKNRGAVLKINHRPFTTPFGSGHVLPSSLSRSYSTNHLFFFVFFVSHYWLSAMSRRSPKPASCARQVTVT